MNDIVFPNKNEDAFLARAQQWNIDVLFVYRNKKDIPNKYKERSAVLSGKGSKLFTVYRSTGEDRKAFDQGVGLVYDLERSKQNDRIYSRRSGLNQVLAKIAHTKGITLGFSFTLFKEADRPSVILGRMRQNYRLCKKYNVPMLVGSFVNKPEDMIHPSIRKAYLRLLEKVT